MADNKTPINYGTSEATRLQQAADVYGAASSQTIADIEQSYKDKVNELAKGIVTGMTPQEKSILEKQVQDLGNRYTQAISATQGQFAFAQQQAQTTAETMADQYAQMQDAQRALAEQTLGAARTQTLPGGLTAAQRDAALEAQRTGAANLAYIGGGAAAPQEFLSPEQRGASGVMGVANLARTLYAQSLEAQKAASRAQLEGSRVNLQTSLEARAMQAAAEREQKQRDQLREFELTGFNAVLAAKTERDNRLAELRANAAAADTRTERDKALAELDIYQKKSDIDLKNRLKEIAAQAKSTGATSVSTAASNFLAEVTGSSSAFGKVLNSTLVNRPQGAPYEKIDKKGVAHTYIRVGGAERELQRNNKPVSLSAFLADEQKMPSFLKVGAQPGIFYMSGGQLIHDTDPLGKLNQPDKTKTITSLDNLNSVLNTLSGYLQQNKMSKATAATYVRNYIVQNVSNEERVAIRFLFGTDDPAVLSSILVPPTKTPTTTTQKPAATTKPTTPPATKPATAAKPTATISLGNPYGLPPVKKPTTKR